MNSKYPIAAAIAVAGVSAALIVQFAPLATAASTPTSAARASTTQASVAPVTTAHVLALSAARRAADVAMAACIAKGFPVSVTVVDRDGVVIDQERADTATGATVAVSQSKAYAAVGFQVPTAALQDAAKTQPGFTSIAGFSVLPGGLPISASGSIVAGIGVSGAPTGEIDAGCATLGVKTVH